MSLPSLTVESVHEKQANVKNFIEDIRLQKVLDHLEIQERIYKQLFRKEKQVVEHRRSKFMERTQCLSFPEIYPDRLRVRDDVTLRVEDYDEAVIESISRSISMPETKRLLDRRSDSGRPSSSRLKPLPSMESMDNLDLSPTSSITPCERMEIAAPSNELKGKLVGLGHMKPHFFISTHGGDDSKEEPQQCLPLLTQGDDVLVSTCYNIERCG